MKLTISIQLFLFFLILPLCIVGQTNIISNGDFEIYSDLPENLGEWQNCLSWSNAGSTVGDPDFFHYDGSMAADLPETPVANIHTQNGKAMMGFVAAKSNQENYREYVTNELSEPLQAGVEYKLSFYISNGYVTSNSYCGLGVSDLGVAFTEEEPVQVDNEVLALTPTLEIDSLVYEREWVKVEWVFEASEASSFLTIGVFDPDAAIEIEQGANSSPNVAYYFVDNFSLEIYNPLVDFNPDIRPGRGGDPNSESNPVPEDQYYSDNTEFYIPNAFTPDGDGINDVFKPYSPNLTNYSFEIFDRWGDKIFATDNIARGWNGKHPRGGVADCGVYIWRVTYLDETNDGEKITRSLSGSINLIR